MRGYAIGSDIRLGSKIGDVHVVSVTGVNDSASIKFWVGFDNAADECRLMASAHNKTDGINDDDNVKAFGNRAL
jgi:hypothetical protein